MRHEIYLAKVGLGVLIPLSAVLVAVGAVVAGGHGALSAFLGVAVMAVNHALAVASTGWARELAPKVIAVSFGVFVFRLTVVFVLFAVLATVGWIHGPLLAAAFCSALVVSLGAECLSYARGSYVPAWRTTR